MKPRETILAELKASGNRERAEQKARFFRTGPGEYGEGDRFLGVSIPATRSLVRKHRGCSLKDLEGILNSPWHEARLFALIALSEAFKRGSEKTRERIFHIYLSNTAVVNNWDLVDTSAYHIAGGWLLHRSREPLFELAVSESLWERRIAMIATLAFIRNNDFDDVFRIAEILLFDREDLIQKAVGWMLREVGNRNMEAEEAFLLPRYSKMPRTMLRYAIEKFEPERRKAYLKGTL